MINLCRNRKMLLYCYVFPILSVRLTKIKYFHKKYYFVSKRLIYKKSKLQILNTIKFFAKYLILVNSIDNQIQLIDIELEK